MDAQQYYSLLVSEHGWPIITNPLYWLALQKICSKHSEPTVKARLKLILQHIILPKDHKSFAVSFY